jgi:hypothetical protein
LSELNTIPKWQELLVRKQKMFGNFIMSLEKYASTPAHYEAIQSLLEMSRGERTRIERSIEARAARSDPRLRP